MIENIDTLYEEFSKASEIDFSRCSVKTNEVYAAFFFGLTITMSNTYELPPTQWGEPLGQTFIDKFGFSKEHAVEFLSFLMQSMQPRTNPKFYAVIRLGMDAFYDLEDGNANEITSVLPSAVSSILGTNECDVNLY